MRGDIVLDLALVFLVIYGLLFWAFVHAGAILPR